MHAKRTAFSCANIQRSDTNVCTHLCATLILQRHLQSNTAPSSMHDHVTRDAKRCIASLRNHLNANGPAHATKTICQLESKCAKLNSQHFINALLSRITAKTQTYKKSCAKRLRVRSMRETSAQAY